MRLCPIGGALLALVVLPPALAGQQAPLPDRQDGRVHIDGSYARLGVAYLRNPDPSALMGIARTPAALVITEHARRVTLGSSAPTATALVARLFAELDHAGVEATRLEALLHTMERDHDAQRRCRAEAGAYLPGGALDGAVVHLTLGYDIGVALAGAATLNLAHPRFRDAPRELWYYCVHELHHAGFMRYHDLPELASVRTTTELAGLVRRLTFMEGLAVHAARGWRAAEGGLDGDPDYVALGDPDRMRRYVEEYFRLHDALAGTPDRPVDTADWEIVARMSGGDRLWYRVGAAMADRIERSLGRRALLDAVVAGADRFFGLYDRAVAAAPTPGR